MFIKHQFIDTIDRAFDHGASVVVLGFDDYSHVPVCQKPVLVLYLKSHLK
jgi:hypothetical protein